MNNNHEKAIKDAQFRKNLSIAFFNATNAAIEMMRATGSVSKEKFVEFRNWFLDEHAEYHLKVIDRVGLYDPALATKRLNATKNLEELKAVWLSFSQDERQDESILKVKNELKQKYEATPSRTAKPRVASAKKG